MSPKRLLRTLILIQIPLAIVLGAAAFLLNLGLPSEIRHLLAAKDSFRPAAMPIGAAMLVALLVANAGLYRGWRPARTLYLIAVIASVLASLYLGPFANKGPVDFLETALDTISGIILGLIYFSPATEIFDSPAVATVIPGKSLTESNSSGQSPAPRNEEVPARSVQSGPVGTAPVATEVALKCGNCGAPSTGKKFCEECGVPFAHNVRCPHCGSEVTSGKKFCGDCGGAVR